MHLRFQENIRVDHWFVTGEHDNTSSTFLIPHYIFLGIPELLGWNVKRSTSVVFKVAFFDYFRSLITIFDINTYSFASFDNINFLMLIAAARPERVSTLNCFNFGLWIVSTLSFCRIYIISFEMTRWQLGGLSWVVLVH